MNNNKPAIAEQSKEYLLMVNGFLEQRNTVLMQTCSDFREIIKKLQTENETLKAHNAVLKCTVQRISGVE